MSLRMASGHLRHITGPLTSIRHASTRSIRHGTTTPVPRSYGRKIYVYSHLQTNQVVYSLSQALKNNRSIKQLPFNGKKTVPRALRKDLWSPLAQISLGPGPRGYGLSVFQKLREYRRRHELEWDDSLMKDADGKIIPKKKRGRQINDQKANSVADIAAVLGKIGTSEGEEIGLRGPKPKYLPVATSEGEEDGPRSPKIKVLPPVEVKWVNMLDAEFAETWTENVVHDQLKWEKNNRDPEYWAKTTAQDAFKQDGSPTPDEKEEKQLKYWSRMDEERRQWYLSQDRLDEMKPRRPAGADPVTIEERAPQLPPKQQELRLTPQELQQKQQEYWDRMDEERRQWYLRQNRLHEMKPRKPVEADPVMIEVHRTPQQKQQEYWNRMDEERRQWYLSQNRLQEMKPRKHVEVNPVMINKKGPPRLQQKQQEYWDRLDEERRQWYLSQNRLHEMKPRKHEEVNSAMIEKKRASQSRQELAKQEKKMKQRKPLDTILARQERSRKRAEYRLARKEASKVYKETKQPEDPASKFVKQREYWALLDKKREEYYIRNGKSLAEMKPRNMGATPFPAAIAQEKSTLEESTSYLVANVQQKKLAMEVDKYLVKKVPKAKSDGSQKVYWASMESKRHTRQGESAPVKNTV